MNFEVTHSVLGNFVGFWQGHMSYLLKSHRTLDYPVCGLSAHDRKLLTTYNEGGK